jgi:hypothetical protein
MSRNYPGATVFFKSRSFVKLRRFFGNSRRNLAAVPKDRRHFLVFSGFGLNPCEA